MVKALLLLSCMGQFSYYGLAADLKQRVSASTRYDTAKLLYGQIMHVSTRISHHFLVTADASLLYMDRA